MADEDSERPSLELPSIFRRRHRVVEPAARPPRPRRGPPPALPAAALTGAVVALLGVGLVWLGMRGCTGLRGTSSCGNPGYLVLLAIFVVVVLCGRLLLGLLHVPDAGATAFLGATLLSLVALVFAVDLHDAVSAAVLALVGAATFAGSQWLTSTFVEPGEHPR